MNDLGLSSLDGATRLAYLLEAFTAIGFLASFWAGIAITDPAASIEDDEPPSDEALKAQKHVLDWVDNYVEDRWSKTFPGP